MAFEHCNVHGMVRYKHTVVLTELNLLLMALTSWFWGFRKPWNYVPGYVTCTLRLQIFFHVSIYIYRNFSF